MTPIRTAREYAGPRAATQSQCFVCGALNPHGLHLHFETGANGVVSAHWHPTPEFEGFAGIIHGGIVTTVLDEAMSKAVASRGWPAFTCEVRVRLHRHVQVGVPLTVCGWVVEKRRRRVLTEAYLAKSTGEKYARAWGTFLEVSPGRNNA